MPLKKIHQCKCRVNLLGQNFYTVVYDEFNPVTWPEVQVLMQLHGEENVMEIVPCGISEVYPQQEKERLAIRYGRIVETVFPGRAFRMELMMTGDEDLPVYVEGQVSTKVAPGNGNGEDHDDGEDEDDAEVKTTTPVFKPGRHRPSPTVVPPEAKEA
jgi:hypothetical protein